MRRSTFVTSCLTALALTLGAASSAVAGEAYVRYQQDADNAKDGALQTAVATFRHPTKKVEIILYGVVHIADKAYYQNVQRDLDSYDVVLYEGVKPGKAKPTEADKGLGQMQKMMGEMLGLTFQKDGINYKAKNLVHADMDMDQFKKAMGGNSINPLGGIFGKDQMKMLGPIMKTAGPIMKALMRSNPAMQDNLKRMLAGQLGNANMNAAMGKKAMQVILIERNKVVMKVLAEQLQKTNKGTVAIFYGAAHNPDFEERLAKLGFQLQTKRWMSAWTIGQGTNEGEEKPSTTAPKSAPKAAPETGSRWF
jgi:hypothetical protein